MNRKQQICLWAGIIVFVLMGVFPSWYHTRETATQYRYSFLLAPPSGSYTPDGQWRARPTLGFQLDTRRLYVPWIMVAVVTGGFMLTFHQRNEHKPPSESGQ